MELPNNIVQLGKPDRTHKIYIEDYVITYIKEWNRRYEGTAVGMALYGKKEEENNCKYYFIYGASRIEGLEKRGPYLSQADKEEVKKMGAEHFVEYEFLAWTSVREELPENIFVATTGKGIEVNGYACFYEANEAMLSFMLKMEHGEGTYRKEAYDHDGEENYPGDREMRSLRGEKSRGAWNASQYRQNAVDVARKQSEERERAKGNTRQKSTPVYLQRMKFVAAAMFVALSILGIATLNDPQAMEELQVAAQNVIAQFTERKLPDSTSGGDLQTGSQNMDVQQGSHQPGNAQTSEPAGAQPGNAQTSGTVGGQNTGQQMQVTENHGAQSNIGQGNDVSAGTSPEEPTSGEAAMSQEVQPKPVSYTIVEGDTLIGISQRRYGNLSMVKKICELNQIKNPDNIEVGQIILLP